MDIELIKKRLRVLGMTQAGLAAKCGVSKEFICMVIAGQKTVSIPVLKLMAQALEVTTDELLDIRKGEILR